MTQEFINRQLSLLSGFIADYENNRMPLNSFINKAEAILSLSEMSGAYKIIGCKINVLEDINAFVFEGISIDKHDEEIINKILMEIKEYIDSSIFKDI